MQLRARVEALPVRQRIILSGTPIQNNLMEMHALFDLVSPGLLGDAKAFKDTYERRINAGSDKYATLGERERGAATATMLRRTVAPYMLRREKKDVFKDTSAQEQGQNGVNATSSAASAGGGGAFNSEAGNSSASTSSSLISKQASENEASSENSLSSSTTTAAGAVPAMPRKNDFVVWLRLKGHQRALYEAFLNSDSVREVLNRTRSALASITVLKKICDHPALLSERAQEGIIAGAERATRRAQHGASSSEEESAEDDESDSEDEIEDWDSEEESVAVLERKAAAKKKKEKNKDKKNKAQKRDGSMDPQRLPSTSAASNYNTSTNTKSSTNNSTDVWNAWAGTGMDDRVLEDLHTTGLEASCKTVFVLSLLRSLVSEGHRTLVFSQSRVMLNILEAAVRAEGWPFCRIDGGVSAAERAARVATFQSSSDIPVFLLTSQVGGLGLTLTAADRVIVVDPAWNPSVDSQSVDRAYRIGQKRDVVIYRLISCGTVEDKIYRKQVFKGGLSRTGTEDGEQFRYFSAAELRDMFRLDPTEAVESATQRQLHALHAHQRQSTPELETHLKFLETLEGFAGVSDHDLLYSVKAAEGSGGPGMGSTAAGAPVGAAYQPGGGNTFVAPSPSRKPGGHRQGRVGGGGHGGGGGQEWSGGNDLSAMFGRALNLGGDKHGASSYEAVTAAVAAATGGGVGLPKPLGGGGYVPPLRRLDSLQGQLKKQQTLLANPVLVGGLADGGAKLLARAESLQQEIITLEAELADNSNTNYNNSTSPLEATRLSSGDPSVSYEGNFLPKRSSLGQSRTSPINLAASGQVDYFNLKPSPASAAHPSQLQHRKSTESSASTSPLLPNNVVEASRTEQQQQQQQQSAGSSVSPANGAPPPPLPPGLSPKIKASFGSVENVANRVESNSGSGVSGGGVAVDMNSGFNNNGGDKNMIKRLKWELFEGAKALKAAESAGDSVAAAGLRKKVEKLNAEYETAKRLRKGNQN